MQATPRINLPSTDGPAPSSCGRDGLALTTSSEEAAACYRDALDRVHGAEAGAAERLDEAIALDPAFAVAHAARWMLASADGDARVSQLARDAALSLRFGVTAWERSHIELLAAMIERQPGVWAQAREHLAEHPRDLLIASQLVGELFFHGGEGKREAVMALLRQLEPHHRDDWAFAARLGFHMSELGEPRAALGVLDSALRARPGSPFVAHATAHALLESGQRAESHRFLREWVSRNDPTGPIDGHIHWHLSLGELESKQPAAALERYLREIAPGASHCAAGLVLADAGGLFGRMLLAGMPVDGVPRESLDALLAQLKGSLGAPFVAAHAAALLAALGDRDTLDGCIEAIERSRDASTSDTAYLMVTAFRAYVAGDMRACVAALEGDRPGLWETVGGSNEERALIATLYARAKHHLGEELMSEPNEAQILYWNGRAGEKWAEMQVSLDAMLTPVTAELKARAGAVVGQRVVDIGCGTGETCALWLDGGAEVVGVDVSAPMLALAVKRMNHEATLVEADASVWRGQAPFDLAVSRFGVMFFDAPEEAFATIAENLRPGGRLLFTCWRAMEENEWVTTPLAAVADLLPEAPPPPPHAPGAFALADGSRLRAILERAGFVDVAIHRLDFPVCLASEGGVEAAVRFALQVGPAGAAIGGAGKELRPLAKERLRTALAPHDKNGLVILGGAAWLVEAVRPGGDNDTLRATATS